MPRGLRIWWRRLTLPLLRFSRGFVVRRSLRGAPFSFLGWVGWQSGTGSYVHAAQKQALGHRSQSLPGCGSLAPGWVGRPGQAPMSARPQKAGPGTQEESVGMKLGLAVFSPLRNRPGRAAVSTRPKIGALGHSSPSQASLRQPFPRWFGSLGFHSDRLGASPWPACGCLFPGGSAGPKFRKGGEIRACPRFALHSHEIRFAVLPVQ
jgi:hypothetical protein